MTLSRPISPALKSSRGTYSTRRVCTPDGKIRQVRVNLKECPLAWLRARGMVTERQHDAGDRLRDDWEAAGLGARTTMRWDLGAPGKSTGARRPADPTLRQMSARDRLNEALAAAGPDLSDVLWRVVCAGEGLSAAEKALGWPARAGKLVLGFALDRVADYYRLP